MVSETGGPTEGQQKIASESAEKLPDATKADIGPPLNTDDLDKQENAARKKSDKFWTDIFLLIIYVAGSVLIFTMLRWILRHHIGH